MPTRNELEAYIIDNDNAGPEKKLNGFQPFANLEKIVEYEIPITDAFFIKASKFLNNYKNKSVKTRAGLLGKLSPLKDPSLKQPIQVKVSKIPVQTNTISKKQEIIALLENLRQLITGLPIGIEVQVDANGNEIFVENSEYDRMISVLKENNIEFDTGIKGVLEDKIKNLQAQEVPKKKKKKSKKAKKEQLEEDVPEPAENVVEAIAPDQLDPNFIAAQSIADKNEEPELHGLDKYTDELINAYKTRGQDFTNMDHTKYASMTDEQIAAEIKNINDENAIMQASALASEGFLAVPEVVNITTLEDPLSGIVTSQPNTGLIETVAGSSASVEQVQQVPQTDPSSGQDTEPEINTGASGTSIITPYKERYHKEALTDFFENSSVPKWDPILEKNILGSNKPVEERAARMDSIIANHGSELFIQARKSDTLEELNELQQLQFCLLRNLHLGPRIYQSVSVNLDQINKIKTVANSLVQTQGPVQGSEQVSQIEQELSSTGSAPVVQSEGEYKFDIFYDNYLKNSSRRSDIPIRTFTENKTIIKETEQSIPGKNRSLYLGKARRPDVGTLEFS